MRPHPHLYEINTLPFTRRLSRKYGRQLTLATIPDVEWQSLVSHGFDLVWLMGVWQRSPGARAEALRHPDLRPAYDEALPGWDPEDIGGSPYAVYEYTLDRALGQPDELTQVKSRLNKMGLGLIVDFVPNHLALDHPWTTSHPDWFVHGGEASVRAHPEWFFSTDRGTYLAHGRDRYMPPWTDTVQVNFRSRGLRLALIGELLRIAEVADGVRCDMAMLGLNRVFDQVWGSVIGERPVLKTEFWAEAIQRVKEYRPDFLFMAEVYWGLDRELQDIGFDFTYDKALYDMLRFSPAEEIRRHLTADERYQRRSVRFIENHDELRAVVALGHQRSLAAATVIATIPGLRFFHDGQLEGRHTRLPVQLSKDIGEPVHGEVVQFYDRLLTSSNAPVFHEGEWQLREMVQAWPGNESHRNILAWSWRDRKHDVIVAVNYSADAAQGYVRLPLNFAATEHIVLTDELTGKTYTHGGDELIEKGLYVGLAPYQSHVMTVARV